MGGLGRENVFSGCRSFQGISGKQLIHINNQLKNPNAKAGLT